MTDVNTPNIPQYLLSDFINLKPIDHGGEGVIFLTRLGNFGQIAVKQFIRPWNECKKEIEILINNRHPNIVDLYGIIRNECENANAVTNGYVMEYIPGGSLHNYIHDRSKRYDLTQICVWMKQVCCGLQFLHYNHIIHRDIKPKNILVAGHQLKLADFGTAKNDAASTTAGAGTLCYMAPEMVLGKSRLSSDIYSLAITIWEIFHRKLPYSEQNATGYLLQSKILRGFRPSIDPYNMNEDVAEFIQRCWHENIEYRPQIGVVAGYFERRLMAGKLAIPSSMTGSQAGYISEMYRAIEKRGRVSAFLAHIEKPQCLKSRPTIIGHFDRLSPDNQEEGRDSYHTDKNWLLKNTVQKSKKPNTIETRLRANDTVHLTIQEIDNVLEYLNENSKSMDAESILILGGDDGSLKKELLILMENKWDLVNLSLPKDSETHGTICLDGEIYVFGGKLGKEVYKLYKNLEGARLADMHQERHYITNSCLEWEGCIWVFGGSSDSGGKNALKSVERYDPKENKWTRMPDMVIPKTAAAVAVWYNCFFVCGGHYNGDCLKNIEYFDPESGVWAVFDGLPTAVCGHAIVTYKTKLIVIGGFDGKKDRNSVFELSNVDGQQVWMRLPPLLNKRECFTAVVLNDEIYVIGGWNRSNYLTETEIFDGIRWREGSHLPHGICNMSTVVIPKQLADALSKTSKGWF